MSVTEIIPYRIDHDGRFYVLMLGQQLIGQFTHEHSALMVAKGLKHRGHAERVLRSVRYVSETNSIEDTP